VNAKNTHERDIVDKLAAEALAHRAVTHPYLEALGAGTLPDPAWALRDFARQYAGYSAHFPRFLTALISRLDDPAHRAALLQNLAEEGGHYGPDERAALEAVGVDPAWVEGVPHPALFARFAAAVGAPAPGPAGALADEVHVWRDQLLLLLQAGPAAEAVGALGLGTEQIVRRVYAPLCAAVARHPGLSAEDAAFFPLHTAVDDHHQESLRQIAIALAADPAARPALRRGMLKALQLRAAFWDWLHARALDPAAADGGPVSAGRPPPAGSPGGCSAGPV
jgi:pyrroloquinoline quinone (PQQ) biosynthesis protein C